MIPYDPASNRYIEKPLKNWEAFILILICYLDQDILDMGIAFEECGYIMGFIAVGFIGLLISIGLHKLVNGMHKVCEKNRLPVITYPKTMSLAFRDGPELPYVITSFIDGVTRWGIAYIHFEICVNDIYGIGYTFKRVISYYYVQMDIRTVTILIIIPLVIGMLFTHLKDLAKFALIALLCIILSLGYIVVYCLQNLEPFSSLDEIEHLSDTWLVFCSIFQNFHCLIMVVTVERDLQDSTFFRKSYGTVTICTFIAGCCYAIFGFILYWRFADETDDVSYLLPFDQHATYVSLTVFNIGMLLCVPIRAYVFIRILWVYNLSKFVDKSGHKTMMYFLRITVAFVIVFMATFFPTILYSILDVRTLILVMLSIVFPGLLDIYVRFPDDYGPRDIHLKVDVLLLFIGCLMSLSICIGIISKFFTA